MSWPPPGYVADWAGLADAAEDGLRQRGASAGAIDYALDRFRPTWDALQTGAGRLGFCEEDAVAAQVLLERHTRSFTLMVVALLAAYAEIYDGRPLGEPRPVLKLVDPD